MTTIAGALTDRYADWEVALLMAEGRSFLGLGFVVATPAARPVTSMGGMTAMPQAAIDTLDPNAFDALVVCGGESWQTQDAPDISATIRAFSQRGKLVAGICAATLALARAGVLDDVAHTSNALELLETTEAYHGRARYRNTAAAVSDANIITAAGTAPVTFTAEIFRALGHGSPELDGYVAQFGQEFSASA